jgi:DNA-binding transcriptional ArsR family regulator
MAQRHAIMGKEKMPGEVLGHPLRVRILAACTERETSLQDFAEREKVRRTKVGYHFRILEKESYIRVSRKERVRGFQRYFYVATRLGVITDEEFADLAVKEQRRVSAAVVRSFHGRCLMALQADTFDSRTDSHFTWTPRVLDEQGWRDQMEELLRGYERANEIEDESKARLLKSGQEGIPTTIALAGFESPPERLSGPAED